MDLKEKIGKRIQQIRKSKKITQDDLGEALGVSREHVSNVENGKSGLGSFDLISDIAKKLDVPPEEILSSIVDSSSFSPASIPGLSSAWLDPSNRDEVRAIFDLLAQGPPEFRQGLEALVSLARKSSRK